MAFSGNGLAANRVSMVIPMISLKALVDKLTDLFAKVLQDAKAQYTNKTTLMDVKYRKLSLTDDRFT